MTTTTAYAAWGDDPAQTEPYLRCALCDEDLCTIEEGDHLSVLVGVVEDHARECKGEPPHVKVLHGRCPICGHYGDDCEGTR